MFSDYKSEGEAFLAGLLLDFTLSFFCKVAVFYEACMFPQHVNLNDEQSFYLRSLFLSLYFLGW